MFHSDLQKKPIPHAMIVLFMAFVVLALVTACKAPSEDTAVPAMPEGDMSNMHMEEEADHEHDTAMRQFIPNDGATVQITTPANDAALTSSDTVLVTIETTNFTIGEDGNHWHIYLDGDPIMVMGGNTYVLQNLSAGQHDIEVYLSNGHHEDLAQGDQVTITVKE